MANAHDVVVIGGGIVGMSTAYAITRAAPGTRVAVLEKEQGPARHQTGRNSGVIHSGIYYRPGSLKARYAVEGAAEMVKFCAAHDLPHEVTGKLIVATGREELPRLHALVQRGRENGIPVRELGPGQIAEYEPHVRGLAAIHVGTTGICRLQRGDRDDGAAGRRRRGRGALRRRGARHRPGGPTAWSLGVTGDDDREVRASGPGELRRSALRPHRPARGRRPGHADRAVPR